MFTYRKKCSLCHEVKTGVPITGDFGHTCLECIVFSYRETLAEEDQDNEQLNEELGITFGRDE
jgi:hypothetical protein